MKSRMLMLLSAVLPLLPMAAGSALAQNRGQSWEFGPYLVATDYDSLTEIDDDEGLGFRFGYNFTRLHQIEVFLDTVSTHDSVTGQIDVRQGELATNYVFNFNFQRHQPVVPYITGGFGFIRFQVDAPGAGSADELDGLFDFGGGVRFFFGKTFNLRLDFRSIFYQGGNDVLRDIDYQNNELSLGVGWVIPAHTGHHP